MAVKWTFCLKQFWTKCWLESARFSTSCAALCGLKGIAVILAGGVLSTALRARALPDTPTEEH